MARRSAPGGRRMRLHGLHGRSTRTTRSCGPRGAYRAGSDGPKIATTGVPTAPARCIGPVSPVTNRSRRSRTAASVGRSTSPDNVDDPAVAAARDRTVATSAAILRRCRSARSSRRRRDQPSRDFGEALRLPLLDRASAADVHADERPVAGSSRRLRGVAPARRFGNRQSGAERPIGRVAPKTAATSRARVVGRVRARVVRRARDPAALRRRRWRYPAVNAAPDAASSRLLRMSGSKLIARSYRRCRQVSA